MKLDTMQTIVKQLPDLMNRLSIPKEFQRTHGHFLGTATESTRNLDELASGDIELLVGNANANCEFKLIFSSEGQLKTIQKAEDLYGAINYVTVILPPPTVSVANVKDRLYQASNSKVAKTTQRIALTFAKKLFKL